MTVENATWAGPTRFRVCTGQLRVVAYKVVSFPFKHPSRLTGLVSVKGFGFVGQVLWDMNGSAESTPTCSLNPLP